jgi:hypothetical protein
MKEGNQFMHGNLVELAQRFVRLSGELGATRDAMKRLFLNGARLDGPAMRRGQTVKRFS